MLEQSVQGLVVQDPGLAARGGHQLCVVRGVAAQHFGGQGPAERGQSALRSGRTVHGTFVNAELNWIELAPLLASQGYCVYAPTIGRMPNVPLLATIGPAADSAAS